MARLYGWAMIIATGLTVAAALLVTRAAPTYTSSAEVLVGPTITSSGNYIQPSMPTEQRVATSSEVIRRATDAWDASSDRPIGALSVSVPVDTQVLVMSSTADTRADALAGAELFARTYLQVRNPEEGEAVARMVSPPTLPADPVSVNYPVVLGVAVVAGLLIGFCAARAWDRIRGRIRTIEDAERCTGLDAVAVVPRASRPVIESLAARVLSQEGGPRACVLVTSVEPRGGSAPVAAPMAASLARMGRVVLLVTAQEGVPSSTTTDELWPRVVSTDQEGLHLVSVSAWDGAGLTASRLSCLLPALHDQLPEALIVIDGPPAWASASVALRADRILVVVTPGRSSRAAAVASAQALDHCADKTMGLVVVPRPRRARLAVAAMRDGIRAGARRMLFRFGPLSGVLTPGAEATSRSALP